MIDGLFFASHELAFKRAFVIQFLASNCEDVAGLEEMSGDARQMANEAWDAYVKNVGVLPR